METGMQSAVVIGSGPNGLAAAIRLAQSGLAVEVREAAAQIGGGARSGEITLPGFVHDLGSAVHPLAVGSPFFSRLPLADFGLRWIYSPAQLAHPFDDGSAAVIWRDVKQTAGQFGSGDREGYRRLFEPLANRWNELATEVLRPLRFPHRPFLMAGFGLRALQPCTLLARSAFRDERARALFAGICAHSTLKLEAPLSAAFGIILGTAAHAVGWPVAEGGAQSITNSLAAFLKSCGGRITPNAEVRSLAETRGSHLTMCDVTPKQFLGLAANHLRRPFRQLLENYEYGPGVCKVDYALSQPIPWRARECHQSITIHLGGSLEEIAASERAANEGRPPEKPFVLLAQPSLFDRTRAPRDRHTAWAYCHVPNGWTGAAGEQLEAQIERFAPGFRECVLARAVHTPAEMQCWNSNLIGGDINGGVPNLKQFVLRPTWRRYRTPIKGVYFCSSSTPPGGAVHGMCGYWAAEWALRDFPPPNTIRGR